MVTYSNLGDGVESSSCAELRRSVVDVMSYSQFGLDLLRSGHHTAAIKQLQNALTTARKISRIDQSLLEIYFREIQVSPCHVEVGRLPLDHNTFVLNSICFTMSWIPRDGTASSICQTKDFFAVVLYNLGYAFHISSLLDAATSATLTKRASKLYSLAAECLSARNYWNLSDESSLHLTLCIHNNWSHLCFQHFDRHPLTLCLQVLERCMSLLRSFPERGGLHQSICNAAILNLLSSESSKPAPAA